MKKGLLLVACAAAACAGRGKVTSPAQQTGSALAQRFPVTRQMPGGVTYALVFRRLDLAATAGNDFLAPFPQILIGRPGDYLAPWGDDEFRAIYGMAPFNAEDLERKGFAIDRSAGFYSTAAAVTIVLPVRDRARVLGWLEDLAKLGTVVVGEHRGLPVTSFTRGRETYTAAVGGEWVWIHARLDGDRRGLNDLAWLDEVLDSRARLADEADLAWAAADGRPDDDGVGVVRVGPLLKAFDAGAPAPRRDAGLAAECRALEDGLASAVKRVALHGKLERGKLDGSLLVELSPAAVGELRAHLTEPPDGREAWAREQAGLLLEWLVDLDWLGQVAHPYDRAACGDAFRLLDGMDAGDWGDPVTAQVGSPMLSGYGAALLGAKKGGTGAEVSAVAWSRPLSPTTLATMLVFAGDAKEIAGVDVVEREAGIDVIANPVDLVVHDAMLWVAMGPGVMEKVLGAAPKQEEQGRIGEARLEPGKLGDIDSVARVLAAVLGGSETDAKYIAWSLRSYVRLEAAARLEDGGVRVSGGWERPAVREAGPRALTPP